jgi:hypothetical protein
MLKFIGGILLMGGFMAIAGSAGDCDGKCMEYANTYTEMFTAIGIGLVMMVVGGIILLNGEENV